MKVEEKQSIIRAAQAYMEEKGISQNELSKLTGVNVSYLSGMMKGVFTFVNSRTGKESEDRKSTRLNSSHSRRSRMPSSA